MNDWYIDRSKNIVNNSLEPVLAFLYKYDGPKDTGSIITKLIENNIFDEDSGNLNAALTRFRDHGFINNDNSLGDSSVDFLMGRLSRDELIIDLLLKRPALKKNSPNLKPFVLICVAFDILFDIAPDTNDVYLSFDECQEYLCPCNSLSDINIELIDAIISNRTDNHSVSKLKSNEIVNLSIWFNALSNTPVFIYGNDRTIIRPNPYARDFFKFISINGGSISVTPTISNKALYNYYCSRNNGVTEIIPDRFIPNVTINNSKEAKVIIDYLFGIKIHPGFQYNKFFENDCFGIYNSFLFLPRLAIRSVWIKNKSLGNSLLFELKTTLFQ